MRRSFITHLGCLLVLPLVVLGVATPALAQCQVSFAPAVNYAAGNDSYSVAVGDFNADGRPDLAVANLTGGMAGTISILLGNVGGTFQSAANYVAGSGPISVAVGDFNADGRPDLVVANSGLSLGGGSSVSILLGNLSGTFQLAVDYLAGGYPVSVAVGDFNADGRPDLAVANRDSSNVSVLLGNLTGTFLPAVNYAAGIGPFSIAVGDFDADGRPDLAVANVNGSNVSILLGNLSGTFQAAVNYAVGAFPHSVAVGDFNADGLPDLAVANLGSSNVSILLGNVGGTFQAAVNYGVGAGPRSVAVGDFNADGRPDLVVANIFSNNVSILPGNGSGTFQAAVNYAAGSSPASVAVGDFDADGRPDLAVANITGNDVSVLLNTGSGFPPPVINQQPASQVVQAGQNAALAIAANGFGSTLTYQWRKNGVPVVNGGTIAGATSPTLSFMPVLLGDFASYDVQVTSPASCSGGTQVITSAAGILSVIDPCAGKQPTVTQHPAGQSLLSGNAAMFTVAATSPGGGGPLSYQWRKNGVNLSDGGSVSGATTTTLTIGPAALLDNGQAFDAVVTNTCGSTPSNPAGLSVAAAPVIFGACCRAATCTLVAGAAGCAGGTPTGTYLGDGTLCAPIVRGGTINACCPADFNSSGVLNVGDIFGFLSAWFAGCP